MKNKNIQIKFFLLVCLVITIFSNELVYSDNLTEKLNRVSTNDFLTITKLPKDLENMMYNNKNISTQSLNNRVDFTLNTHNLMKAFNGKTSIYLENFPVGKNQTGNLRLYYSKPAIDKNTKITVMTKKGAVNYKLPEFMTFYGTIDGDPESDVYLNISEKGIDGIIQNGFGNTFNVGQNLVLEDKVKDLYTILPTSVEETMYANGVTQYCGTNDKQAYESFGAPSIEDLESIKLDKNGNLQATSILECNLALESDFVYFFMFKKKQTDVEILDEADNQQAVEAGVSYMNKIVAMGSRIYQREVNITFRIGNVIFNANPDFDQYYNIRTRDLSEKLDKMPQAWSNRNNISRTLVTLFSNVRSQPAGATVLGIAQKGPEFTGVLCSNEMGYSAVGVNGFGVLPTFNYLQDLQVFVHEVGHNFSSSHTHNCDYQPNLDTCVTQESNSDLAGDACIKSRLLRRTKQDGDIMSYCHIGGSIVYKFHPQVKRRIRGAAEKKRTSCMPVPSEPTLHLTYPIGSEKMLAGKTYEIGWNVEKVNRIKLSYSIDGGNNWVEIVGDRSAINDSTHRWTAPDVATTNALIKIEDVTNPNLVDISVLPFEIIQKKITITAPLNGQKVGYTYPFNIKWSKSNVNNVTAEYSIDNGKTWIGDLINTNVFGDTTNFPNIATKEAKIRVRDISDNEVFDEVTFELGKETAKFDSPKTGGYVCTPNPNFTFWLSADFVSAYRIWFSNDGKKTSRRVTLEAQNQQVGSFEWKNNSNFLIPTENAFVWVTPVENENDILTEEGPFIIYDCPLSVEDGTFNDNILKINNISPNPANDKVVIDYYINSNFNNNPLSLEIFDLTGNQIGNIKLNGFVAGNNQFEMDLKGISQGNYFIVINYGDFKSLQNLKIVR